MGATADMDIILHVGPRIMEAPLSCTKRRGGLEQKLVGYCHYVAKVQAWEARSSRTRR